MTNNSLLLQYLFFIIILKMAGIIGVLGETLLPAIGEAISSAGGIGGIMKSLAGALPTIITGADTVMNVADGIKNMHNSGTEISKGGGKDAIAAFGATNEAAQEPGSNSNYAYSSLGN